MKPDLRRIAATLGQLHGAAPPEPGFSIDSIRAEDQPVVKQPRSQIQTFPLPRPGQSFPGIRSTALSATPVESIQPPLLSQKPAQASNTSQAALDSTASRPIAEIVQPFPVQQQESKAPVLPRSKPLSISHHRHASNPGLAVTLLKEIEARVMVWQQELEQIIQQIRSLYAEGPIVDGWLESQSAADTQSHRSQPLTHSIDLATLRHAEVAHLLEYVEELCRVKQPPLEQAEAGTSYRLCGLDADGKLWSRPCPAQQVPYVSLAIARYQKLRILFSKKQSLENRLQQLVQSLTLLHGQLNEL
ncbi:hypothetical protein IFO70_01950 [Phormidium tenue FACHB-886]|nr:hypothetical protein [Phormidium tenue FACHB-886]